MPVGGCGTVSMLLGCLGFRRQPTRGRLQQFLDIEPQFVDMPHIPFSRFYFHSSNFVLVYVCVLDLQCKRTVAARPPPFHHHLCRSPPQACAVLISKQAELMWYDPRPGPRVET